MVIQKGGKSHPAAVWQVQVVRLTIGGSHLACKVANKCLNVRESMKVVERNKNGPLPSPAATRIVSVCERKP